MITILDDHRRPLTSPVLGSRASYRRRPRIKVLSYDISETLLRCSGKLSLLSLELFSWLAAAVQAYGCSSTFFSETVCSLNLQILIATELRDGVLYGLEKKKALLDPPSIRCPRS